MKIWSWSYIQSLFKRDSVNFVRIEHIEVPIWLKITLGKLGYDNIRAYTVTHDDQEGSTLTASAELTASGKRIEFNTKIKYPDEFPILSWVAITKKFKEYKDVYQSTINPSTEG